MSASLLSKWTGGKYLVCFMAALVNYRPPATEATNESQKSSLSLLNKNAKYALYENLMSYTYPTDDFEISHEADSKALDIYHKISCRPIIKRAEDDMVLKFLS